MVIVCITAFILGEAFDVSNFVLGLTIEILLYFLFFKFAVIQDLCSKE